MTPPIKNRGKESKKTVKKDTSKSYPIKIRMYNVTLIQNEESKSFNTYKIIYFLVIRQKKNRYH